jgi:hypothetical protein
MNQLIAAYDLEYITEKQLNDKRPLIEELANKLNSLRNYQLSI